MMTPEHVIVRIWDRVDARGWWDCWPWKLSTGSHGYGQIGWKNPDGSRFGTTAHRVVWEAIHGPIPGGLTIDHECRNRTCCNPLHLRLLTNVENARLNGNAIKTHCKRGHPFDEENTGRDAKGNRSCRKCKVMHNRNRSARSQQPE